MNAVIIGASGLVGSHLVQELVKDNEFGPSTVITRRATENNNPKLINKVVNFENSGQLQNSFDTADVIFCSVGTTQKKVEGDEKAYRKVDYDIPVNMAKVSLEKGVKQYILVSVVGADRNAGNFYLRLKGEVEDAIATMGFESLYILRPSMLLGKRNEFRLGETIGKAVMQSASVLFFGQMRKYYPVKAKEVARAMVSASKERRPGIHILHYDEISKLATC
jgi:uncharacterized protein YbjT (DUF2867 family)